MGSVKNIILPERIDRATASRQIVAAAGMYFPPEFASFGKCAMEVGGTFSVKDMKKLIPQLVIKQKAEALTMETASFFEFLANRNPEIKTTYKGLIDHDGKVVDVQTLLDRGETSNVILMDMAHVPATFAPDLGKKEQLAAYRQALSSGELQCGVADVESIFRKGFPLGSSSFKKMFEASGDEWLDKYNRMATYDETVAGLDELRAHVESSGGVSAFPDLELILNVSGLGETIPNPGFVLKKAVYDTTTKFALEGDVDIDEAKARELSGLSEDGYDLWKGVIFPQIVAAQLEYCDGRGILNKDGKAECVAYRRRPVVTDFLCTIDENRKMLVVEVDGTEWAIPSNKEIQRAIFKQAGVDVAIADARSAAVSKDGSEDTWMDYMPAALQSHGIDIREVAQHSCNLMESAIAEVANRSLGQRVFDAKPMDSWVRDFVPYASKVQYQE